MRSITEIISGSRFFGGNNQPLPVPQQVHPATAFGIYDGSNGQFPLKEYAGVKVTPENLPDLILYTDQEIPEDGGWGKKTLLALSDSKPIEDELQVTTTAPDNDSLAEFFTEMIYPGGTGNGLKKDEFFEKAGTSDFGIRIHDDEVTDEKTRGRSNEDRFVYLRVPVQTKQKDSTGRKIEAALIPIARTSNWKGADYSFNEDLRFGRVKHRDYVTLEYRNNTFAIDHSGNLHLAKHVTRV